jgi:hypothetical protein
MGDGGNTSTNPLQRFLGTTFQVFTFGWTYAIPTVAFLWTIVILIYALGLPSGVRWGAFATAVITGSCSFLGGGLVGFLFGIPRSASSGQPATAGQYQANSNLVEVSDWLTKIIVGVGLVQIGRVVPALTRLAGSMKAPLGGQPSSAAFGIALVIANVLLGFLFFYLWARSLLERNLELSDGSEQDATALAVGNGAGEAIGNAGVVGSPTDGNGAGQPAPLPGADSGTGGHPAQSLLPAE